MFSDPFTYHSSRDKVKEVVLSLNKQYITIFDETRQNIQVVLSLAYAKCLWTEVKGKPGICFIHAGLAFKFVSSNNVITRWKKLLRSLVLVSDFHEMFKVTKRLGNGSFAKVFLTKHKTTGVEYAVKQFAKKHSFKTRKGTELL